jgi:dUTP pyrophosphatase
MQQVKIKLDVGAKMPTRAHEADAGLDLYSPVDATIYPANVAATFGGFFGGGYSSVCIDTGVHVQIPAGYVGMVKSKSGLNVNCGITSEGVIDSGYTGSIVVKLYNHGNSVVKIEKGQKISQLVILPIITPELELVDELEETERGSNGFGSTGKK